MALCHWWGVGRSTAERWRRAFGVGRMDSPGSRRLILDAVRAGVVARGDARPRPKGDAVVWTRAELALVGVLPDGEMAGRAGRTLWAVRAKRRQLGRPNPEPWPGQHRPWTAEQDEMALTLSGREAAAQTGHTPGAVCARRRKLLATAKAGKAEAQW